MGNKNKREARTDTQTQTNKHTHIHKRYPRFYYKKYDFYCIRKIQ